jgi:hypothetical protein
MHGVPFDWLVTSQSPSLQVPVVQIPKLQVEPLLVGTVEHPVCGLHSFRLQMSNGPQFTGCQMRCDAPAMHVSHWLLGLIAPFA